ncbi:DUF1490 family protein [Mycobacterium sp. SM1]|uniref:DUF1490 family protein n=1 Tax=Mycobacterium sp. SM1 TaxID=2816243 RepID=UPI001BCC9142|nr:DUF1490 family protein [Mycobacterium sp. SM1]MBS4728401.1 DUF1490 family protein [Mycobacterium sp. SM1]
MALHPFVVKAAPHVLTFAAYEVAHRVVAIAPWREATVSAMACGVRGVRKAEDQAERVRLTAADMLAEAVERSGKEAAPSAAADAEVPSRRRTAKTSTADADH